MVVQKLHSALRNVLIWEDVCFKRQALLEQFPDYFQVTRKRI
jgi:hypothetical protein